jgi:hypothetical protein
MYSGEYNVSDVTLIVWELKKVAGSIPTVVR